MNKDIHTLSESYETIREQQFAKFGVSQAPQTPKPGLAGNNPQLAAAFNAIGGGMKATPEQEKAVKELIKSFGLPESAAPYVLRMLVQNMPMLKQQYGL